MDVFVYKIDTFVYCFRTRPLQDGFESCFWVKDDGRICNIGQYLQYLGICTFFPNTARWDIADCSVSTSFKAKYRVTIWLDD